MVSVAASNKYFEDGEKLSQAVKSQDNAIAVDISDLREKIRTLRLTAMTMSQYLYFSVSER